MEKKTDWKLELDDLLEDYWGDTDDEKFGKTECRIFELVEEELSKAREEGRKEERDRIFWELDRINCVDEALPKNYSAAGMQLGINKAKEIVLQKELSKLKQ